ncbi:MAG: DEAD/DEAH box helicase [Myxococcaceae bacterium]
MSQLGLPLLRDSAVVAWHPALAGFHPLVAQWFAQKLGEPSEPQVQGWPLISKGHDVLISAPTGSGKTLAAFLAALDRLFQESLSGRLREQTRVLYVSPLKALSNDVQKNLMGPLEQLAQLAEANGFPKPQIRAQVRTGDTPASERASMVRRPPHVLVTTPESLYLYLTSPRARATLQHVDTVIVDELHALARDKRGTHLMLSLERLKALMGRPPQVIGLSATQKPIETMAQFLTGAARTRCRIVEVGHQRPWQISIETPDAELGAVATHEMWGNVYDRLVALAQQHKTVLIFTNTRRLAERVAHDLSGRLGKDTCCAHHGSMSRELRLSAEERLKAGRLKVLVATASLELGLDIGAVDLVVQLGSPRAIAVALQRIGRSNHHKGGVAKGIFFAFTRDELAECTALLAAIRSGELDRIPILEAPLDVLAQHVVAACASEDWEEERLFELVRRAHPYRELSRAAFDAVVHFLSEGVSARRGRQRVHLHHDRVNGVLRARRGARLFALTNGGAIPDTFNLPAVAQPEGKIVGTLDEDFAIDSMAGDVFVLGSTSWRITRVGASEVHVEDAQGAPPSVPFWRGEAPGRTIELSKAVGELRERLLNSDDGLAYLETNLGLGPLVAEQLMRYIRAGERALGAVPTQQSVIAERFFDEAGGMQLIIHAPFGSRINRAWGMALRKRFCRQFDFELQAAATDDGVLLSLGEQHSFPLEEIFDFLSPDNVEDVLTQAILQAPLFATRFRWNATRALALARHEGGKRVPPFLQRGRSEDLLAAVFPAQVGCQDNHGGGDIEVPDHPLVHETLDNCLHEAMDVEGLKVVLSGLRSGAIQKFAVDTPEPSPFAHALVNANPYAFLDDAPLEERRTRAVAMRRSLSPEDASAAGALDAAAIDQVVSEAAVPLRDAEELHDALLSLVYLPYDDRPDDDTLAPFVAALAVTGRVGRFHGVDGRVFITCAERAEHIRALHGDVVFDPPLAKVPGAPVSTSDAALAVVRGWLEVCGPITSDEVSRRLGLMPGDVDVALATLEGEGQVLRGRFRPLAGGVAKGAAKGMAKGVAESLEWCDRRLLQRIHRLTLGKLRKEIEPLTGADFMRFLFRFHGLDGERTIREDPLHVAIRRLEGFEAPATAWEQALLPARVPGFQPEMLERACFNGEVAFGRLSRRQGALEPGPRRGVSGANGPAVPRAGGLTFATRQGFDWMVQEARAGEPPPEHTPLELHVVEFLKSRGACFLGDVAFAIQVDAEDVEATLWTLLSRGEVSTDGIDNLRRWLSPKKVRREQKGGAGRWAWVTPLRPLEAAARREKLVQMLLQRYGIVLRELAAREPLFSTWRELLPILRRLEARGEVRGGRFVTGMMGEQFALPEAVDLARALRRREANASRVTLWATDPLNLTGLVTPGARVPAVLGRTITYVDGVPEITAGPSDISVYK